MGIAVSRKRRLLRRLEQQEVFSLIMCHLSVQQMLPVIPFVDVV